EPDQCHPENRGRKEAGKHGDLHIDRADPRHGRPFIRHHRRIFCNLPANPPVVTPEMPSSIAFSILIASMLSAGPTISVHLVDPKRTPDGLTAASTTAGDDGLTLLREGEWSMGQVQIRATAQPVTADPIVLRIAGGTKVAPVPALVRHGLTPQASGPQVLQES